MLLSSLSVIGNTYLLVRKHSSCHIQQVDNQSPDQWRFFF
jgi:hypothetical protein